MNIRRIIPIVSVLAVVTLATVALLLPSVGADEIPIPEQQAITAASVAPVTALMAGSAVGAPQHQSYGPIDVINNKYLITSRSRSPFIP